MREIKHPRVAQIELADLMYALSDPARIDIVRRLAKSDKPLTCGQINADRPKSSMSHHFKILREAGLIETHVEGKEHFNELRTTELDKRFPGLVSALVRLIRDGKRG